MSSPNRAVGATILVVDDDALITINTADMLTEHGHTALEAFSGAEALDLVERHPEIAAIITDYAMPGFNGLQLAEAARKLRPGLPVLLTTGYADLQDGAGIGYPLLEKPFSESELAGHVKALLAPNIQPLGF